MGIISSLKTAIGPNLTDYSPIRPTTDDERLDGPAVLLLLLSAIGGNDGYHNKFWLHQYMYQIEREIEDRDIPFHGYDWTVRNYPDAGGKFPRSQELIDHLQLLGTVNTPDKPALHTSSKYTFGGQERVYYRVTGYTDLFISKYFRNSTADVSDVEDAINTVLGRYEDMDHFTMHDKLVEQDAEKFF